MNLIPKVALDCCSLCEESTHCILEIIIEIEKLKIEIEFEGSSWSPITVWRFDQFHLWLMMMMMMMTMTMMMINNDPLKEALDGCSLCEESTHRILGRGSWVQWSHSDNRWLYLVWLSMWRRKSSCLGLVLPLWYDYQCEEEKQNSDRYYRVLGKGSPHHQKRFILEKFQPRP